MSASSFTFENTKPEITNSGLLNDLRETAQKLQTSRLGKRAYQEHGKFAVITIQKRFGSWNAAILAAGLLPTSKADISENDLLNNLEAVWIKLGRQPRKREMIAPLSEFTHSPYVRRYGGWLNAIKRFLHNVQHRSNKDPVRALEPVPTTPKSLREPSLRLRFLVMRRDRFTCQQCGRSPATTAGLELELDHVTPWSKGGLTTLENLRTLCSDCNSGKSNLLAENP